MVKKLQKLNADKKKSNAQLSSTVKESAQQIWLAGMGAFAKAQAEGGKVFEAVFPLLAARAVGASTAATAATAWPSYLAMPRAMQFSRMSYIDWSPAV